MEITLELDPIEKPAADQALSPEAAASLRAGLKSLRLYDLEGYEAAVGSLRRVLQDAPDCGAAHAALGETYAYWGFRQELGGSDSQSLYDLAYRHASLALQTSPEYALAHRAMSVALRRGAQADGPRRLQEITTAVDLDPGSAENWYELWRASGYELEDPSIKKALELDCDLIGAHIDLGVVYCLAGRMAEATEHLLKALKLNPRHTLASYNLAMVLHEQGDRRRAEIVLRRALEFRPDDPLLKSGRAHLEWEESES